MRLRCPGCGLKAGAEAWGNDAAARDFVGVLAKLPPPLPAVVLNYLAFFRPEKSDMAWPKALRLIKEIQAMVITGSVQYGHKPARRCPPSTWAQAMERMAISAEIITRPLPNHVYLIKVAWGMADEADAQMEKRRIEAEQSGRIIRSDEHDDAGDMTAEDLDQLPPELRSICERVGKSISK